MTNEQATTLITNCRTVSSMEPNVQGAISIRGGLIEGIFPEGESLPAADHTYDAGGCMALPGFIDIHVHGAAGHDVTDGTADSIEAIARAKLAEGVTTFLPTTLSLPEADITKSVEAVAAYMQNQTAAKVPGVHLEGPFLNPDRCGAQNDEHIRPPDLDEVKRYHAIAPLAIVTCAFDVPGGVDFVRGLSKLGIIPSCAHSNATYAQFLEAKTAGLRHLSHFCNAMSGLEHREVGLVGAGLLDDDIIVELICDRVHLAPEMIAIVFKAREIHEIMLVTDAIHASGLPDGDYSLGGMDIAVKDGVARIPGTDALAGSTLRFNIGVKNAFEITGLPLEELVQTAALNQARALNLEKTGLIREGWKADINIMDDDFGVRAVFVDGEQRFGK